jgi:flagellin-like protein
MKMGKRAISPLIATIILIAICIVGGLLIYSVFMSTSGILSSKAQVSVEAADLVVTTGDHISFSMVIKNTGNKPIEALNVTLNGEAEAEVALPSGKLQPGQSVAYIATPTQTYVIGNTYNVVVEAVCSDGSTFVTTTGVTCRYA